jgi:hypothetical protein
MVELAMAVARCNLEPAILLKQVNDLFDFNRHLLLSRTACAHLLAI